MGLLPLRPEVLVLAMHIMEYWGVGRNLTGLKEEPERTMLGEKRLMLEPGCSGEGQSPGEYSTGWATNGTRDSYMTVPVTSQEPCPGRRDHCSCEQCPRDHVQMCSEELQEEAPLVASNSSFSYDACVCLRDDLSDISRALQAVWQCKLQLGQGMFLLHLCTAQDVNSIF